MLWGKKYFRYPCGKKGITTKVVTIVNYDLLNIVILETDRSAFSKDPIPVEIFNFPDFGDTVKLRIEVKYGTSSQNFIPRKKVNVVEDSLFLSYEFSNNDAAGLSKKASINRAEIPPPVYYSIEKIAISKSPDKHVMVIQQNLILED